MAKGYKTGGGSRKGIPNKRHELKELLDAVFAQVDPVEKIVQLLNRPKDPATEARVLLRLMEYAYGQPRQEIIMEERKPLDPGISFAENSTAMGKPN